MDGSRLQSNIPVKYLYAACDDGGFVEIDSLTVKVMNVWPIAGVPDVTFSKTATGLVPAYVISPEHDGVLVLADE